MKPRARIDDDRLPRTRDLPLVAVTPGGLEDAIRQFKKQCQKAGVLAELKRRQRFIAPSSRRRSKARKARERARRQARAIERRTARADVP